MMQPLRQFLAESTVHSFAHLTGDRKPYVKVIWAIAFLISASYCCVKVFESCGKFTSKEVGSTIKTNSLDFEFPDVYMCSEVPISGSCTVNFDDDEWQLLRNYRALVKQSLASAYPEGSNSSLPSFLDNYAARLINSLPFQFLADNMGHRMQKQNLVFDFSNSTSTKFYHPSYINCIKLSWPAAAKVELQSVSVPLQLVLFSDTLLPPQLDGDADIESFRTKQLDLKPMEWDFIHGYDYARTAGIRVFFVPRGHYPSDLDTQIVAGVGQQHRVVLTMQDVTYNEQDFAGQCINSNDKTMDFVNPYSRTKDTYKYSQGTCWYREIARLSQVTFNCSAWPMPLPWEFRGLRSCFNITPDNSSTIFNPAVFTDDFTDRRKDLLTLARQICENLKPCKSRVYSYQYSSSSWPSSRSFQSFIAEIINGVIRDEPRPLSGLEYLVRNGSFDDAKGSLLQLLLSGAELRSSEVQLAVAYSLNSLTGDIGGFIGLFLGASFLSVLEILELLHEWALIGCRRKPEVRPNYSERQQQPTTQETSAECELPDYLGSGSKGVSAVRTSTPEV